MNLVTLFLPTLSSLIRKVTLLFGTASMISQLPSPTSFTSESNSRRAPTPSSGPTSFLSMPGSRSASVFQSSKRRKLLIVSYTTVSLRLVSTEFSMWRLDGSRKPTATKSTATMASEIRISIRRVIQVLQGRTRDGTGRRPIILARKIWPAQPPAITKGRSRKAARGRLLRSRPVSDQLEFEGLQHGPGAVAYAQLGEDVGDVVLDRPLRHSERVGDFLVGKAAGHQPQDLGLALGQRVRAVQADEIVAHVLQSRQQPLGHGRLDQRPAGGDGLDRPHQLLERHILEQVALGAGLEPGQHQLVVVERGQDDRGRQ